MSMDIGDIAILMSKVNPNWTEDHRSVVLCEIAHVFDVMDCDLEFIEWPVACASEACANGPRDQFPDQIMMGKQWQKIVNLVIRVTECGQHNTEQDRKTIIDEFNDMEQKHIEKCLKILNHTMNDIQ